MKITQAEDEMYQSNMFSKEELMAWEEKHRADKTWVHLRTYFKDRWTVTIRYQCDTPHTHVFESATSAEEDRGEQAGRLATNLHEVAVAATADKEHIQQMMTRHDNLMKAVSKQQAQIDKNQTQIDELMKQNGQLINKISTTTNTNTGGATSGGAGNIHRGRYRDNCNTNSNDTGLDAGDGTNNRTDNLPKCAISPFVTM